MRPFKTPSVVRWPSFVTNIPSRRTFVASIPTQNEEFDAQKFIYTGLKLNTGVSKLTSHPTTSTPVASVPTHSTDEQISFSYPPQILPLLEMLHGYDRLTVDLVLQDPVIMRSTIQRITKNSLIILGNGRDGSAFVILKHFGYDRELDLLMHLLCLLFAQNDGIKLITLKVLMDLMFAKASSLQSNKVIVKKLITTLLKHHRILSSQLGDIAVQTLAKLDSEQTEINSSMYLTQYSLFKFVIVCSLLLQKPLLASSFYISLINNSHIQNPNFVSYLLLNNELLLSVTNSLLVYDPKNHLKNLLAIVKLNEFQNQKLTEISRTWNNSETVNLVPFMFKLTSTQQSKLLSNCLILDDETHISLKIHVFEKLLNLKHEEFQDKSDQLATYLRYSYQLIESNMKLNNDAKVYFIWSKINKYHTILYNAQINTPNNNPDNNYYYYSILSKLIRFFSKNQRYRHVADKLIQDVPIKSCVVYPELMDALLIHAARNEDISLSDVLIQQLGNEDNGNDNNYKYITHLTRGQLTALLALHLKFHDSEGVEKIVNLIYHRFPEGLDHIEMNMICKLMLAKTENSQDQFEKIWMMYESLDPYLSRSLATLIIDYMIENRKMDFEKIDIIFKKLSTTLKGNDQIWEWISALYIKYLSRNFPLRHARRVYQASSHEIIKFDTLSNPFLKHFDKAKIYLPYKLRKLILKSILDSAVFHKEDQETAFWCLEQLEQLGYGYKETMLDLALSKKDLNLKSELELDFSKTPKKQTNDISLSGLSEKDQLLSVYFDKDLEKLYINYLGQKNKN